jgi:large subunit ribosomal protein L25
METMTIKAEARTIKGTRQARRLREQGRLPAIIYGHGVEPMAITLERHDLKVALSHGARTLHVEVHGDTKQYLIKEVQYDHLDHEPIHVDLARVHIHERVEVEVGIEFKGTPKGVNEGGMLEQFMTEIEVECLVTDIPSGINVLVTELGIGDSLYVKDLPLPSGVKVLADPEDRVAIVREAAAVPEEEEEAAVGEEEPAQPEVIGRARKEEEEGES